jgi:hypothetical protein
MLFLFSGLVISILYGSLGVILIWYWEGLDATQQFVHAYAGTFKTVIAFGLVLGITLIIARTQNVVSKTVEEAFTAAQLSKTSYYTNKRHFHSLFRTVTFAGQLIIVGFAIFTYCRFPLTGIGEILMMIAACIQYACGSYVGRKLVYIGMMLHSLMSIKVSRNLFEERKLDEINAYVNVASTLTIIAVYVHVMSYLESPFLYDSMFGESLKIFLIFPAVIATPVLLIFNFYPRAVLRRIYSESIDVEIRKLGNTLQDEGLSDYEKRSYIIQFDKMSRDELRYNLQLTLTDLPIGITILFMVLQPLLKK